jgi:hypothetical protein
MQMLNDTRDSEGPLAEFVALRAELLQLGQYQHQLVALNLTFAGAVLGFVVSRNVIAQVALVVPVVSYLLCMRSVMLSLGIHEIGCYIRDDLDTRVCGGLRWERWLQERGIRGTFFHQTGELLSFPISSGLALAWSFGSTFETRSTEPWRWGVIVLWLLGSLGLAHQLYEGTIGYRSKLIALRKRSMRSAKGNESVSSH